MNPLWQANYLGLLALLAPMVVGALDLKKTVTVKLPLQPLPLTHWYLRAGLSDLLLHEQDSFLNKKTSTTDTSMRPRWRIDHPRALVDVGVGRNLHHHLRADLTLQRFGAVHVHANRVITNNSNTQGDLKTSIRATSEFLNLYWEVGRLFPSITAQRLKPYVNAGLGLSHNISNNLIEKNGGTQTVLMNIPRAMHWAPAWQSGAGFSYALPEYPLSLELGYKYINLGKAYSAGQLEYSSTNEQLVTPNTIRITGNQWLLALRYYIY